MQNIFNTGKLGVCFDTCHIFAAGYDCSTATGKTILDEIEQTFGREKVRLIHANNSSKKLGSRRDRHAHIGEGFIGEEGFEAIMSDVFSKNRPFILETLLG